MKTKILLATGAALVALGTFGASHQAEAITTNGTVDAVIVQALTLTAVDDLDFGNIAAGTGVSEVTIAPASGARTLDAGDAVLIGGGTPQDGTFNLDGEDGLLVTIDLPANGDITVASGPNTMAVDDFTYDYDAGADAGVGDGTNVPLSVGGPHTLSIGATLFVGAAQAAGTYTSTFPVTVTYE